ncbi:MAG: hypothetical protein OEV17_11485, partial [Nitrospira sp.]|nr:hypothetical protein [Nitrospira sp.]
MASIQGKSDCETVGKRRESRVYHLTALWLEPRGRPETASRVIVRRWYSLRDFHDIFIHRAQDAEQFILFLLRHVD